eukprot:GHVN01107224.1.p1 GENE.GHVN01107224.1~~GHVN01107224.1.p1  ORF type:complete len:429 (+),score=84.99 GHVN01107224.1:1825-3111(+)
MPMSGGVHDHSLHFQYHQQRTTDNLQGAYSMPTSDISLPGGHYSHSPQQQPAPVQMKMNLDGSPSHLNVTPTSSLPQHQLQNYNTTLEGNAQRAGVMPMQQGGAFRATLGSRAQQAPETFNSQGMGDRNFPYQPQANMPSTPQHPRHLPDQFGQSPQRSQQHPQPQQSGQPQLQQLQHGSQHHHVQPHQQHQQSQPQLSQPQQHGQPQHAQHAQIQPPQHIQDQAQPQHGQTQLSQSQQAMQSHQHMQHQPIHPHHSQPQHTQQQQLQQPQPPQMQLPQPQHAQESHFSSSARPQYHMQPQQHTPPQHQIQPPALPLQQHTPPQHYSQSPHQSQPIVQSRIPTSLFGQHHNQTTAVAVQGIYDYHQQHQTMQHAPQTQPQVGCSPTRHDLSPGPGSLGRAQAAPRASQHRLAGNIPRKSDEDDLEDLI